MDQHVDNLTVKDMENMMDAAMDACDTPMPDMIMYDVETWRHIMRGYIEAFEKFVGRIRLKIKRCDPDNVRRIAVFEKMIADTEREIRVGRGQITMSYMPKDWRV